MSPILFSILESNLLLTRAFLLIAVFAMIILDLISHVRLAAYVITYGYANWPITLKDEIGLLVS